LRLWPQRLLSFVLQSGSAPQADSSHWRGFGPNIVERALEEAVLHRKNALFYRTLNGAQVGDLFMSLIHTCLPRQLLRLSDRVAAPRPETGGQLRGVDAVELSRDVGADRVPLIFWARDGLAP
jgi:hypothetical protein